MVAERGATYAVTPQEESQRARIADSVETTLKLGGGVILVSIVGGEERMYSENYACVYDGISLEELAPRSFSFNNPHGACPECTGLGTKLEIDRVARRHQPRPAASPRARFCRGAASPARARGIRAARRRRRALRVQPGDALARHGDEAKHIVLRGTGDNISFFYRNRQGARRQHSTTFEGVIPNLERRYKDGSESAREDIEQYMSAKPCPVCKGAKLKPETLAVTVGDRNIVQIGAYSIVNAMRYFEALTRELDEPEQRQLQRQWERRRQGQWTREAQWDAQGRR